VVRRIFRLKTEEVIRDWRTLYNVELYGLYFSPNIIQLIKSRRMRLESHVVHMRERKGAYRVLVGKHMRKKLLVISRYR
jgi:hypothetical protein